MPCGILESWGFSMDYDTLSELKVAIYMIERARTQVEFAEIWAFEHLDVANREMSVRVAQLKTLCKRIVSEE